MIYVTIFRKKLSSLPVSDYVIKFYILHQILFFLHFEATVSCLKLSAHKEQPNTHDLSMLIKKWILVAPCFTYHSVKENVNYFFSAWFSDYGFLGKNDQQWKTFRVIYNMTMFQKKISLLTSYDVITFCIWRVSRFPCILKS